MIRPQSWTNLKVTKLAFVIVITNTTIISIATMQITNHKLSEHTQKYTNNSNKINE